MQKTVQRSRMGRMARAAAFGTVLAAGLMMPGNVRSAMMDNGEVISSTDSRPRFQTIETSELDAMKQRINDLETYNKKLNARVRELKGENEGLKRKLDALDTEEPQKPSARMVPEYFRYGMLSRQGAY